MDRLIIFVAKGINKKLFYYCNLLMTWLNNNNIIPLFLPEFQLNGKKNKLKLFLATTMLRVVSIVIYKTFMWLDIKITILCYN